MHKFLVLLERELKAYFYSPLAYVVMCFFLGLTGFMGYAIIAALNRGPSDYTLVFAFFNNAIFWFSFITLIPLLTMRLYSEEFKLGTIETLMTAPVNDWQVVASKFAGAFLFYAVLWLPTTLYFVLFKYITKEQAADALGAFGGSYLLLLLMGAFYLSLGCLASVVTRNQIVAAIIATVLVVVFFFTGELGYIFSTASQGFRDFISYFSTIDHMRNFTRGLVDTRAIVFYVTMTLFLQVLTFQIFQFRKWKS